MNLMKIIRLVGTVEYIVITMGVIICCPLSLAIYSSFLLTTLLQLMTDRTGEVSVVLIGVVIVVTLLCILVITLVSLIF